MKRKTGERWWLRNEHELGHFTEHVKGLWAKGKQPTVEMLDAPRSVDQNRMFYALYRDIAAQREDMSMIEVRADCKLRYGVVILKGADPEFAEMYDRVIKPMSLEDKLLLMQTYPITSHFTKEQGSAYIDSILHDYTRAGYALADPRTGP
jgi:hypothetical protein